MAIGIKKKQLKAMKSDYQMSLNKKAPQVMKSPLISPMPTQAPMPYPNKMY